MKRIIGEIFFLLSALIGIAVVLIVAKDYPAPTIAFLLILLILEIRSIGQLIRAKLGL